MFVPDFQSIMLPLLNAISKGKQWQLTAIREELARLFHLSPDERRELLPSGTQCIFDNRVAWAKTYLVKAELQVFNSRPDYFNLKQAPAFVLPDGESPKDKVTSR